MSAVELDLDFEYPTDDITVTRDQQAGKLACCGIDGDVFGEHVDPTHFATETILAARRGGVSINGSVHVGQVFDVRGLVRLGETVTLSGRVTQVEPASRGDLITCSFELVSADGERVMTLERTSLRADPNRMAPPAGSRPGAAAAPLTVVSRHQLEPDRVARYSSEADNLIHSDPEVARRFGFRAPIAGGLMAVRFMMAHLWRHGAVARLRMGVRFRRPMFWDDALVLNTVAGDDSRLVMVRASDGKVVNEAVLDELGEPAPRAA